MRYTTTTYDLSSMIPQDWRGWDSYRNRLSRYEVYDGYYHNIAYHTIVSYSEMLKWSEKLYKHVRGVFNPVQRLVELYVAKTFPGALDTENAMSGAIPITGTDDETLRQAIITLWQDSRWGIKKNLPVRNGARFGDAFIKIVDDIANQSVYMETLDPRKIKTYEVDATGKPFKVEIEYYIYDDKGRLQTYCEAITLDMYRTFLNGQPYAANMNGRGEAVAEWPNEYGFIPIAHVPHRDMGQVFGANAFYGSIHKINELNDLASIVNDGARKQVNMPLISTGVRGNIDLGSDNSTQTNPDDKPRKDTMPVINLPNPEADLKALAPTINLADAYTVITGLQDELERDLPELSLHRLRQAGNLTAPGVRSAYDDAIARFTEARGNYDTLMVEAQKMGVAIGGMRGYAGYAGFNLVSLENGQLDHQIKERPVIGDTLSKREKIELAIQAVDSPAAEVLLDEIGYDETQIETIMEGKAGQTDLFMLNQQTQPQSGFVPDLETPDEAAAIAGNGQVNATDLIGAAEMLA